MPEYNRIESDWGRERVLKLNDQGSPLWGVDISPGTWMIRKDLLLKDLGENSILTALKTTLLNPDHLPVVAEARFAPTSPRFLLKQIVSCNSRLISEVWTTQ